MKLKQHYSASCKTANTNYRQSDSQLILIGMYWISSTGSGVLNTVRQHPESSKQNLLVFFLMPITLIWQLVIVLCALYARLQGFHNAAVKLSRAHCAFRLPLSSYYALAIPLLNPAFTSLGTSIHNPVSIKGLLYKITIKICCG
jgi:hypothetical protein